MHANHRTYHKTSCLNLRTFWGVHTNHRIYHRCASAEDLKTQTPTWGHYQGQPVSWPGCHESHADLVIPQHFQRASWAHNLLEIGPQGLAHGHDSRLLRLKFDTNNCKYNALSLGFQHLKHAIHCLKDITMAHADLIPHNHACHVK